MKNILFLLLLTSTLATRAQTPANDLLSHVPADADQLTDVNLGSITSKMDLPAILGLLGNKTHNNKNLSMVQQLLSSGLDSHQDLIIAQSNTGKLDSIQYFTFIAHLTDSAKFVAFMRAKAKETNGETIHFIHLPGKERVAVHDKDAAAWNDHLAVLSFFILPMSSTGAPAAIPIATAQLKAARRVAAALRGYTDTKFISDSRFTTAFSDGGDIHSWSKKGQLVSMLEKFSKKMPGMGAQLGNMSQFTGKGNASGPSISTIRFDNGRISYHTLKFSSPAELAAVQRMLGQGLSPELLALVPPRPLLGVASFHIDMAALADSLKRNPSFPMIDTMMQGKGFSVMDVLHALKGDFVFLVCQPDKATGDSTTGKKMPAPAMFAIATIGDKAAFEKVLPIIKLKNALTAPADSMTTDTLHKKKNPFPYYLEKDDLVVFGKRHQLKEFLNAPATGDPIGKLLPEKVRENTFDAGIDIHAIVTAFLGPMLTSSDSQGAKSKGMIDMVQQFQTLQISFGAVRDGAIETNVELKLADQNKNSLTVLTNIITTLAAQSGGTQPQ